MDYEKRDCYPAGCLLFRKEFADDKYCSKWWCGVDVDDRPVGNPKRRCDEHSSKSSLSYETKVESNQ
jgi:hypothetical protein